MSAFDLPAAASRCLGETGDATLVSLTREELRGLGDDPLLANAAETLWWDSLTEREQELVLETAQRSLVARNLLVPGEVGDIVATDEVRLVLAARTAPDRMLVLAEPTVRDSDGARLQLALLAPPSESGASPGVLVSARVEGVYLHRLVTTDAAPGVAADWLLRAAEPADAEISRTVELLVPVTDELQTTRALVVGREDARFLSEVVAGSPADPAAVDQQALTDWLRERLG